MVSVRLLTFGRNVVQSPLPPLPAPLSTVEPPPGDGGSTVSIKLSVPIASSRTSISPSGSVSPRVIEDEQQCGSYGPSRAAPPGGTYGGSYGGVFTPAAAAAAGGDDDSDDPPNYRLLQLSSSVGNGAVAAVAVPSLATTALASLNERYQSQVELLKRIDSSLAEGVQTIPLEMQLEICDTLVGIADDFVSRATIYGRTIIEELFVPDEEKTIKPVQMGGMLGGRKYVCANILFKG